jgi:hypothetical protein
MRIGVVELHVQARSGSARDVVGAIAKDRSREAKVRASIEAARRASCDLVVLPGWTIIAGTIPPWLRRLSRDCTLVFECLPAAHVRTENGRWL